MFTDLEVPFTTGKACKHGIVGFSQQGQEHLGLCDACFSNELVGPVLCTCICSSTISACGSGGKLAIGCGIKSL